MIATPVKWIIFFLITSLGKPGIFDPKGRAKWDAWNSKKGKNLLIQYVNRLLGVAKETAEAEYVALVEKLMGKSL